jgi:hypothetical protein
MLIQPASFIVHMKEKEGTEANCSNKERLRSYKGEE